MCDKLNMTIGIAFWQINIKEVIDPVNPKPPSSSFPKFYNPEQYYHYHQKEGHSTDKGFALKNGIWSWWICYLIFYEPKHFIKRTLIKVGGMNMWGYKRFSFPSYVFGWEDGKMEEWKTHLFDWEENSWVVLMGTAECPLTTFLKFF